MLSGLCEYIITSPRNNMFKCITEHPGFLSNCLDIYVLEVSFYEFVSKKGLQVMMNFFIKD